MSYPSGRARSIPACAGEPRAQYILNPYYAVYPRVCGGAFREYRAHSSAVGLSPRVRGSPLVILLDKRIPGSIPACAGEPRLNSR